MDEEDFQTVRIGDNVRFIGEGEDNSTYDDFAPPLLYSRFQQTSIPRMMLTLISIFLLFPIAYLLISSILEIFEEKSPLPTPASKCGNLGIRREWRQLSLDERKTYLRAVTCLTTKASTLDLSTSLYDDFTYAHIQTVYRVHHVAISLPWHRYFIHLYEQALKEECAFEGTLPYWDWTIDYENPLESPIWDSTTGFGGNGSSAQKCVEGGPLQNILLNYTGDGLSPHCLSRNFDESSQYGIMHGSKFSQKIIDGIITNAATFGEFRERFENGPHKHIHDGIGGEMPGSSSPNDPLFFLHHAQSDRLWWMWQNNDLGKRKYEFTGTDNFGSRVSLDDMINVAGLTEEHPVLHMMSTENGPFCYRYSEL